MILDRFRLDGQAAIVTGASRGIGAAIAVALAECGADVVLAARDPAVLADTAAAVDATGRRSATVATDLNELSSLPALVEAAVSSFGRLDVVVNNVGGTLPRSFLDTSPGYLERAVHFNVSTAFELTRRAVPVMLESAGGGSVVNIASTVGHLVDRGYLAYGTAKAALIHLSRLAAADLAPRIRVNVVAPGSIETDALATFLTPEQKAAMADMTPARRLGAVDDIAAAVVFLASEAGSFVTGQLLAVDGGLRQPNLPMGLPDL